MAGVAGFFEGFFKIRLLLSASDAYCSIGKTCLETLFECSPYLDECASVGPGLVFVCFPGGRLVLVQSSRKMKIALPFVEFLGFFRLCPVVPDNVLVTLPPTLEEVVARLLLAEPGALEFVPCSFGDLVKEF